jgi:hypothetical protein
MTISLREATKVVGSTVKADIWTEFMVEYNSLGLYSDQVCLQSKSSAKPLARDQAHRKEPVTFTGGLGLKSYEVTDTLLVGVKLVRHCAVVEVQTITNHNMDLDSTSHRYYVWDISS